MWLFNKKKNRQTETAQPETRQPKPFVLGVLDLFHLKDSDNLVVVGNVKGTVHVGDAVYISNPGSDMDDILLTTIIGIEKGPNQLVEEATDCHVGLCIEKGAQYPIRKASVLFTRDISAGDVHNAYIHALGDTYVMQQKLVLTDEEIDHLSITDCAEIWRLFAWFHSEVVKEEEEQTKQDNHRKVEHLAGALCKKIMTADAIYCLFNKNTGEPHLFSRTIPREDGGYICTPPDIRIFTKAYNEVISNNYPKDKFEVRCISNGENKEEIYNFFGSAFYLNGACGVQIISEQTSVAATMLVQEPDYSQIPKQNIPVTNPALMRWMLLLGQLGKIQSEEEELVHRLYYRFMGIEMVKAQFLIPMKRNGEMQQPDENGKIVLEKDMTMEFPTMDGKHGRPAIAMFTDWKRLRMVYDDEWNGMVQPISGMIDVFDCAINATHYPLAGCYIAKDMYEDMCKQAEVK